jgi:hypothetical protein
MRNETDTCRKNVLLKLADTGWDNEPYPREGCEHNDDLYAGVESRRSRSSKSCRQPVIRRNAIVFIKS